MPGPGQPVASLLRQSSVVPSAYLHSSHIRPALHETGAASVEFRLASIGHAVGGPASFATPASGAGPQRGQPQGSGFGWVPPTQAIAGHVIGGQTGGVSARPASFATPASGAGAAEGTAAGIGVRMGSAHAGNRGAHDQRTDGRGVGTASVFRHASIRSRAAEGTAAGIGVRMGSAHAGDRGAHDRKDRWSGYRRGQRLSPRQHQEPGRRGDSRRDRGSDGFRPRRRSQGTRSAGTHSFHPCRRRLRRFRLPRLRRHRSRHRIRQQFRCRRCCLPGRHLPGLHSRRCPHQKSEQAGPAPQPTTLVMKRATTPVDILHIWTSVCSTG